MIIIPKNLFLTREFVLLKRAKVQNSNYLSNGNGSSAFLSHIFCISLRTPAVLLERFQVFLECVEFQTVTHNLLVALQELS